MYDNNQNNYQPAYGRGSEASLQSVVSSTMKKVFVKMTLGILVTALVSLFCATSPAYIGFMARNSWMMWVLVIAWFGIGIGVSGAINRLSNATASLLFYLFAIINGMMLFTIFLAYDTTAIVKTFFITAGTFGAMAVYGYTTSQDLSKFGTFLIMALFGLIIASVVNIFLHSNTLGWIVSIAGVFIFVGLTAWDTQQVKQMAAVTPVEFRGRLATLGALNLYLDFVNLFLFLLRIFGGSRD